MPPIPSGTIILWSGAIVNIPLGYVLCDGNNDTPDLRSRFLVGAGDTYSVDDTGGAATHSHSLRTSAPPALDIVEEEPPTDYVHLTSEDSSVPPYYALAYIMKT